MASLPTRESNKCLCRSHSTWRKGKLPIARVVIRIELLPGDEPLPGPQIIVKHLTGGGFHAPRPTATPKEAGRAKARPAEGLPVRVMCLVFLEFKCRTELED
jgi:hypothetical protein